MIIINICFTCLANHANLCSHAIYIHHYTNEEKRLYILYNAIIYVMCNARIPNLESSTIKFEFFIRLITLY